MRILSPAKEAGIGIKAGKERLTALEQLVTLKAELDRTLARNEMSQADYDSFFGWNAPWQFNAWFSVGTTLAFIVAVLALGIAKLKRIDF